MKTRARLVVEIVALVAAAVLFAVAYRRHELAMQSESLSVRGGIPPDNGEFIRKLREEKAKASARLRERVDALVAAYEKCDRESLLSLTNGVTELVRQAAWDTKPFSEFEQRYIDNFHHRELWPSFSGERELEDFLRLHLDVGQFICETLCKNNSFDKFVEHYECGVYRQLVNLKSHCETNGLPLQVEVVSKHLKSLVDHIESESGFTRRCVRYAANWATEAIGKGLMKKRNLRILLHVMVNPLIEAGYMPKWLGEIDGLVDRVEAVKCEKDDRP